jgi:uncharacterized protein (DUF488 family)
MLPPAAAAEPTTIWTIGHSTRSIEEFLGLLRGYADYMSSPEFAQGLGQLIQLASQARTAVMCAEALWWRCHRAMIADALSVHGIEVVHILDAKHNVVHPMTSPARIVGGALTYVADLRE